MGDAGIGDRGAASVSESQGPHDGQAEAGARPGPGVVAAHEAIEGPVGDIGENPEPSSQTSMATAASSGTLRRVMVPSP